MLAAAALGLALLTAGPALAELEDRADQPYRVVVALRFGDSPLFTSQFVSATRRQVLDQLAAHFGGLAEVRLAAPDDPILRWLESPGLEKLTSWPADAPDGGKLFPIDVDYNDGVYTLEWRQLDADTRQIGPLHTRATANRRWVGKAICLAVRGDFSPVAVVTPAAGQGEVKLAFRGAAWPDELKKNLAAPCLLEPLRVERQRSGALVYVPIPNTLLRLTATGDAWRATCESNLSDPWRTNPRVVGFQAIKLATQRGRFTLHVVDEQSGGPVPGCLVYAGSNSFQALGDADRLEMPDRSGRVTTSRSFDHVAYIKIVQGSSSSVQIPLPITSDCCELTCKIRVDAAAGARSDFDRQLSFLVQDLQALTAALDSDVGQVNGLHQNKRYEEALKQVERTLNFVRPFERAAEETGQKLVQQAAPLKLANTQRLQWVQSQLREIALRVKDLEGLSEALRKTIASDDAKNRAGVLLRLAGQAEQEGQIDAAIEKYTAAIAEWPDQPKLLARLERLKSIWKIKSPAHAAARDFVYQIWADTDVSQLDRALPQARKSLDELEKVHDYLTAVKLLKINGTFLAELQDRVDQLTNDPTADRAALEKVSKILGDFAALQTATGKFVDEELKSSGGRGGEEAPGAAAE
jgi:tetratricopeptide (TPR) repeat protein